MGWALAAVLYALGGLMTWEAFDGEIDGTDWLLIGGWPIVAGVRIVLVFIELFGG